MVLPIPLKKKKTPRNLIETQRSHLLQKEFCIFRNPLFCFVDDSSHQSSQNVTKNDETAQGAIRPGLPDGLFSNQKYQFG
jgi:hypothetical protein